MLVEIEIWVFNVVCFAKYIQITRERLNETLHIRRYYNAK